MTGSPFKSSIPYSPVLRRAAAKASGMTAVALSFAALATGTWAQVPDSVDPGKIEQRFEERITPPPPPSAAPAIRDQRAPKGVSAEAAKKKFTLKAVEIKGATVYSQEALRGLYADKLGQSVTLIDAQAIADKITAKYRGDEYILSQALVDPKVEGGKLRIRVAEGYIHDVRFEGEIAQSGQRDLLARYAGKIKADRPLKASTLERYLLLMDDLPGATAKGLVRPSTQPGAADLVVTMKHEKWNGSLSSDNRGTEFIGPFQHSATLAGNSLLGLYERTLLRFVAASPVRELRFFDIQHEQQIGGEGTRLLFTYGHTETRPGETLKALDIEGSSDFFQVRVAHPFLRARKENLTGRLSFDARNSETDLFHNVDFTEDRLRILRAGASYDFADRFKGVTLLEGMLSQGLDILGATDTKGTRRSRSDGEADATKLNAEITRVQNLPRGFSILTAVTGQYALDPLLAAEEFSLGGIGFGQAYDPAELSGDHGAAAKIELRYGQALGDPYLASYQVFSYYDIGSVWEKDAAAGVDERSSLASVGLGVRLNFNPNLSGTAEVGVPLTKDLGSDPDDNDPRLFFSLTGRF